MKAYLITSIVLYSTGFIGHMLNLFDPERSAKERLRTALVAGLVLLMGHWAWALLAAMP